MNPVVAGFHLIGTSCVCVLCPLASVAVGRITILLSCSYASVHMCLETEEVTSYIVRMEGGFFRSCFRGQEKWDRGNRIKKKRNLPACLLSVF